jgi:hypothetical protein
VGKARYSVERGPEAIEGGGEAVGGLTPVSGEIAVEAIEGGSEASSQRASFGFSWSDRKSEDRSTTGRDRQTLHSATQNDAQTVNSPPSDLINRFD